MRDLPAPLSWETWQDPDALMALMIVEIAGVGGAPVFAPWFPNLDPAIQRLVTAGMVGENGDTTPFGHYLLGRVATD